MKVLVTGGDGQVGRALVRVGAALGYVMAPRSRRELDLCALDPRALDGDVVVNTAALTAVDDAERDPARAFAVNRDGVGALARACRDRGVALVHISTDYVFDGRARRAYLETDVTAPLNVYGRSKLEGETVALDAGAAVVRTSWVFGAEGANNFVLGLLRRARAGEPLRVVDDQLGCPTGADDLARGLLELASRPAGVRGVYHYCGDGPVTRFDYAATILDAARARGFHTTSTLTPIATTAQVGVAPRPLRAVLDTGKVRRLGILPRPWSAGLAAVLEQVLR